MKKSGIAIIILSVLLCISIGFGIYYYRRAQENTAEIAEEPQMTESEKTFQAFITALNQKNIQQALEYIEPTEAQLVKLALGKLEDLSITKLITVFAKWFPFLSDFSGLEILPELSPQTISVEETEDTSVITVSLELSGTLSLYQVYLIKIEERWFIQYARKGESLETHEVI